MFRLLYTIATAIGLMGTYQVYAFVVSPLLRPAGRPESRPPTANTAPSAPNLKSDLAREFLPNSPWAQDAGYNWEQGDNACLFFNEHERLADGGNKVRLAPFAMIWRDPKRTDGGRYTVEAAGAVVHFQNQFFDDALEPNRKPGRIVHMTLEGKVRICGPDNLQIEGEKFIFSEESTQLYSDWPVTFRFGPLPGQMNAIRGQADQVTIEFAPVAVSPYGPEMPHVGEVTRLRLRRAVRLDLTYDMNGEPAKTLVSSEGPFTYDLPKKLAQFEEKVSVVRPLVKEGVKHVDSLKCHWLGLQFVEAPPGTRGVSIAQGGKPSPAIQQTSATAKPDSSMLSGLALRYLRALSNVDAKGQAEPVHIESTENAFEGDLQDLRYDAMARELVLLDEKEVHIRREATQLFAPQVRVVHGERGAATGNRFELIECSGPGHFEQLDEAREQLLFFGSWAERVHVVPDPESPGNILSIHGGASLVQPDRVQIDGETVQVWLAASADPTSRSAARPAANLRKLPVRRAVAEGNVQMATAEAIILSDRVDARFAEGRVAPRGKGANPVRLGGGDDARRMPGAAPSEPPFVIRAREIEALIVRDPQTQDVDVPELTGLRDIRITREAPAASAPRGGRVNLTGPVEITGQRLHMKNGEGGGPRQIMTLSGSVDPRQRVQEDARLRIGDYRVESAVLVFNRAENRVDVPGPGQLHVPVSTDMRGKKLEKPQPLDVAWVERMSFDGQTARFLQRVKARVGDSVLTCEAMDVGLNRRLDLQSDHPDTTGLDLKTIACRHDVTIEMYEYDATPRLIEVMKGHLAEFHLDNETGEFEGLGPGLMQDWRVAKSGESSRWLSVEPTSSVQTNQPTSEDKRYPWNYAQMVFKGKVTGNIQRQDATLTRHVQILYAPVAQALQVFQRNDLSFESGKDNGNNGAWLGCQELDLILVKGRDGESTAQLRARGGDGEDASLEGRKFTASGHEILYDQGKGQFILRGRGTDKADIHFQDAAGRRPTDIQAHVIEYFPSKRNLILDGATFNGQAP